VHTVIRIAATLGILALPLSGSLHVPHAAADDALVGQVYVNDNTAGMNTIAAFNRHADGSLTPLPGSPFAAGGAGTGTIIGSQGALQVTNDGRYLLAVDAGSSQISVLSVARDGSLHLVGSPVASGGIDPVSIAVHDSLIYVANEGNGTTGSNYTGFTLDASGQLAPLSNSTVALSPTAAPGDVLFNRTGTRLVGTEVGPANGPSLARQPLG
jgi:6-phosphogluconolactonase